jgi:hypothetical protein
MASTVTLEGVKKAIFFPFRGEKWGVKVLIGSALYFANFIIPIVPAIPLFGYFGRIMKRIIVQDEDPELPEWNDWGALFLDGIKLFGALLIYLLPALILTIGGYVLFMVLDFSLVFSSTTYTQYSSNPFPMSIIGSAIGMFGGLAVAMLGMVLIYVTLVFVPPALGNMIAKDDFGAAFHFKEWWPVFKANLSGYVVALAIALGLFTLMYILALFLYATVILCFLLPFAFCFIFFVFGTVSFSLYAIAYRDGTRKLAEKS